MNIPSLNWLRVFEAAARMENFARAAELLDMSTSGVSQQIKALESHFGEQLFERGARNVEVAVLLDKHSKRKAQIDADYVGFECPDHFVVAAATDLVKIVSSRQPLVGHIGQVHKEVVAQCTDSVSEHTVFGTPVVGSNYAHTTQ